MNFFLIRMEKEMSGGHRGGFCEVCFVSWKQQTFILTEPVASSFCWTTGGKDFSRL